MNKEKCLFTLLIVCLIISFVTIYLFANCSKEILNVKEFIAILSSTLVLLIGIKSDIVGNFKKIFLNNGKTHE
ncbi:MAG: hypothetical protein RSF67_07080 [Clostridia bacterium]